MNTQIGTTALGALVALMLAGCGEQGDEAGIGTAAEPADYVFTNGTVYTVDEANPWAEAVAVTGDRISFVGDSASAEAFAGPGTRVIDLQGQFLIPGLMDSHSHIFGGSASATGINLSLADTMEKLNAALIELRDASPGDGVIYARGWQNHLFPPEGPNKAMLDEIFGDRAVVLGSVDGHSSWFSSKSFELAGITADTPDPEPGISYFERDEDGVPTGTTRERAGRLVSGKLLNFDQTFYKAALIRWLPQAAAAGLTGVFDAGAGAPTTEDAYEVLDELEAEDRLTMRVFGSVGYEFGDDDPSARLVEMKPRHTGRYHTPYSIKLYADGVPEGHTAYLLTPYVDRPETRGEPMIPEDKMTQLITWAYEKDVPVHVHAIGDAAIRLTLNAVERAQANTGKTGVPTAIAHMDFVSDEDIPRFAELGVVAQTSIQWAAADPSYANIGGFVGMDRVEHAYPVKSLIEAGAVQTFGADWPASAYFSTYKPLNLIEVGATRQLPGRADMPVRNADQRLGLDDLIAGMTLRVAMQVNAADELGSITVGKKADLVVLGENLFEVEPHTIHSVPVVLTMMDGRITHDAR